MNIHKRIKQALVPAICTVFWIMVAMKIIDVWGKYSFLIYIIACMIPFVYLILTILSFADVISMDGVIVICVVILPIFFIMSCLLLGFVFP